MAAVSANKLELLQIADATRTSARNRFGKHRLEEWEPFISTNFNGVMNCCTAVLPSMTQHRGGRIITVISDAGRVGEPHLAAYSGREAAGAAGFMRAIAKAVGRYDITANCVALSTSARSALRR